MSQLYGPPVIKDKILTNISAAIREIHRLIIDDDDEENIRVITNDDWQVHCLLEHLDFALLYGLKYVQDGYYKCISEFTPKLLTDQIQSLLNIETNIGRGRAWLFHAFNDNLAESYMKCFQDNRSLVKKFYTKDAILSDTQRLIALGTLCSGLENIQFNLKTDCVYFDRSCWPAYFQVDLKDAAKLSLPGVRNDIPTFTTYLSRYDGGYIPSSPIDLRTSTVASKRVKVPKRPVRSPAPSPVVNSYVSSEVPSTNLSRSSSVSCDNPSIDGVSSNDENQIPICVPIRNDSPSLTTNASELSSSLSELDPMLKNRPRTPSPIPLPVVDQTNIVDEQTMTSSIVDTIETPPLSTTIESQTLIVEDPTPIIENQPVKLENPPPIPEKVSPETFEDSIKIPEKTEPSLSISTDSALNDLSIERKTDDLFQFVEEDTLDLPADANLQLQFTLEVYEIPNDEAFIKLFPTTVGHNNGNVEVVFLLVTTINIYLLRQINEINGGNRIDKMESIRLGDIDYIEVGPNEQFFRIITVKHTKLRCLTTGCVELTRAICDSIRKATEISRVSEPQIHPAAMQELSIKKVLANDMKKSSAQDVKLLDYHYTFWEEPQMSGRTLRKEGYLDVKLIEAPNPMRRLSVAALKLQRHGFETWKNAYVTLRVDRLNVYLHKSDMNPALSYTLLDENCQGCRRNRNADKPNAIEIMFANDITLVMSAKSKAEQDEWLNSVMKGLSQGRMATKDEDNSANTVPCSLILTEDKIYVCHDEQDNALIRQLDSIKLEYITRILFDPQYQYYCVVSIEHGNHGSKSWIFYFLFTKEMVQFIKNLRNVLSETYQVPFEISPLTDIAFQRECERTSKKLLRSYHPLTITP